MADTLKALRPQWHVVHGERLALLAQRAVWWPTRSTLIVADLHLGKSELYRSLGVPMPSGIGDESLARLSALVSACDAQRIVVLGDLVHAPAGLTTAVRGAASVAFAAIRGRGAALTLVRGNHDRKLDRVPPEWEIHEVDDPWSDPEVAPFSFAHHPAAQRGRYVLAGHLHPTFSIGSKTDSLRLPCFHFGPRIGVLPAFSAFTRGVPMCIEPGDSLFVVAEGDVVAVGRDRWDRSAGEVAEDGLRSGHGEGSAG